MSERKIILTVGIILVGIGLLFYGGAKQGIFPGLKNQNSYESLEFGFSFKYPEAYFLSEKNLGNGERQHKSIILMEDNPENRALSDGTYSGPPREGPIAISIDVFQNLEGQTAESWLQNDSRSNYKLGNGTYRKIELKSKVAYAYFWSGLYEGNSLVTSHNGNIVMISVTYQTRDDKILSDFEKVLASFSFN